MKFRYLAAPLALLLLPSCLWNSQCLDAELIGPSMRDVCEMHDKLLNLELDPASIDPADRATYLRSSEIVLKNLDEVQRNSTPVEPIPIPGQ